MQNKRSKKMVSVLLIIVFATVFILITRKTTKQDQPTPAHSGQTVIAPDAPLQYTKHARCRMDCRGISEAEVREVLREGHINYQKSDLNDTPCPTYAIEDRVAEGQDLRIVFGICDQSVKVITCIDLSEEHDCACS
ncbi:DUF4258 domain-containing protein [Edaphocola aurantiacus]|uniref:DUF4258 domain-containing protein n=1 Tax=Edaphocola aurantiacus TaxID=2601682 RepID=UPI001C98BE94|nr:DUF4258 domain-containing protein [Edaphocola aurantiacus]